MFFMELISIIILIWDDILLSNKNLSLAIIFATYNRAEVLRKTLEYMSRVNREGITVMFYIVNNNSRDHTETVIKSFSDKLPLHYIFESRQGKNASVNRALKELNNEDIVIFTDDDITPCINWFHEIIAVCSRWPDHDVFGGKVLVAWPDVTIPDWAHSPKIRGFAFSYNDQGNSEKIMDSHRYPHGNNVWFRNKIFSNGRTFNESLGPMPKNMKMGGGISYLRPLKLKGYEFVYSPDTIVKHRIDKKLLNPYVIFKRAYSFGRGLIHMNGLPDENLLQSNSFIWHLKRLKSCIMAFLRLCKEIPKRSSVKRFEKIVSAVILYGISVESLRSARKTIKK